jgi:hypothetical protein
MFSGNVTTATGSSNSNFRPLNESMAQIRMEDSQEVFMDPNNKTQLKDKQIELMHILVNLICRIIRGMERKTIAIESGTLLCFHIGFG